MQPLSMLDATKLATLRAVVAGGSLSAAARRLTLTQPAVSRQIRLLETQLGTPLVRRTRRGVIPTEAGRLLAEHAGAIEDRLRLAESEVAALAGRPAGRVRLGSFFTAFALLTPEIVARADVELPGVDLEHVLVDRAGALAALAAGDLDAAIVFTYDDAPPPAGIELLSLFADPARILLPAAHPLARRDALRIADLAGATWVRAVSGGAADRLDAALAGLEPRLLPAGHGDEPIEAQVYVASGAAVMLAHALCVIIDAERIAARPLLDAPARAVQLAVPRERPPATRALAGLLTGYFSAAGQAIR